MSHPSLTPAQAERLEMLAEEAAEIVQACTKILRHGYESHHPDDPGETNRQHLCREIDEMNCIVGKMSMRGDLEGAKHVETGDAIWQRKLRYTHHQKTGRRICPTCHGNGGLVGARMNEECPRCDGYGEVPV